MTISVAPHRRAPRLTVTRAMGDDVEAPAKRTPFGAKRKEDGDDGKKDKKDIVDVKKLFLRKYLEALTKP